MVILVGSIKYSPIYKSHCCAFGRMCEAEGFEVQYLFSKNYRWMLSEDIIKKSIFIGTSSDFFSLFTDLFSLKNRRTLRDLFSQETIDYVYLHNYHPLNNYIAKIIADKKCTLIYHVHEPKTINKKAHGGFHQYWLYLFEYFQGQLLKNTDIAIVSSNEASSLFDQQYPFFQGKKMLIPLMYEDLDTKSDKTEERKYLTFLGPPVPAKGPDIFLQIIDSFNKRKTKQPFLLITRDKLDESLFTKDNLIIFHKEKISDLEIKKYFKQSIMSITPYTRSTQSSVILVSYMYGTPVLSSTVGGLSEFVSHKKTGYLVDLNANIEEWITGAQYIIKHNERLSKECREYFIHNFSEHNWKKYFSKLLV